MISATADVAAVSYLGGDRVVLSAAWPSGLLAMTATDPQTNITKPCPTGRIGAMYATYSLGGTFAAFMPQMSSTTTSVVLSVADATGTVIATVTLPAVPPFYESSTFDLRDLLPATWADGAASVPDVAAEGY